MQALSVADLFVKSSSVDIDASVSSRAGGRLSGPETVRERRLNRTLFLQPVIGEAVTKWCQIRIIDSTSKPV
jgi:hypothetical protein